jgi:DNA primase
MDRFEEVKLRIKEATDLVALIESYIPLRPRGRNLVACCPFHAENTPSFAVNREGQYYHCFGCGRSGDVFTWLMERDGVSFPEAMEILADRVGIDITGVIQRRERLKGPDPYAVLAEVAAWFHRQLAEAGGEAARAYLHGRGLDDAILPWQLGSHPPRGSLSGIAQQQRWPREVLEAAGLLRDGREPFAGRVMFPIHDERGRVVGFGGRIVPGTPEAQANGDYEPPKYLNSPESPFFNKRRVLFGLHQVKRAGERRLLVMEGYTDVIACHVAGFPGAVASLGTAFTAEHVRLIERFASEGVVLMFDGDRAGRSAAERAMRELVNSQIKVRMVVMSDAGAGIKDPADVVSARPGEEPELVAERRIRFADIIDAAEDGITVWFRLLGGRLDLHDAVGAERAAQECALLLQVVDNEVRRAALRQQMARHLAVPEPALQRMLDRVRVRPAAGAGDAAPATPLAPAGPRARADAELLVCVLARPGLLAQDCTGGLAFADPAVAELYALAGEGHESGRTGSDGLLAWLFARLVERPELRAVLGAAAGQATKIADPDGVLASLLAARRRLGQEPERRSLRQQLTQALAAGDRTTAGALQARLLAAMRTDRPRGAAGAAPDAPPPRDPPAFLTPIASPAPSPG